MPHALILVYRDFIFYPECVFRGGAALSPHFHFLRDRSLSSNVIREAASHCLEAVCLLNCGKMRQLLHLHTFPLTMTGDCLTNFLRIEKEWQLLCDQSRKTNQIFEERQIFLRSVRDFIRASEIKSRSLRFLAERQRFLRSVRDMYSRKKHAAKNSPFSLHKQDQGAHNGKSHWLHVPQTKNLKSTSALRSAQH